MEKIILILLHYATTWELPSGLENEKSIIELAWEKVVKNQSMAN